METDQITVPEAVRQLRTSLGESQQAFAYRMKAAIRTIARYETVRPPKGKALAAFMQLAASNNLPALESVFNRALRDEIGVGLRDGHFPLEENERVISAALVGVLRNARHLPELRKPCEDVLAAITAGYRAIEKRHEAGTMIFKPQEELTGDEFWVAVEKTRKDLGLKG